MFHWRPVSPGYIDPVSLFKPFHLKVQHEAKAAESYHPAQREGEEHWAIIHLQQPQNYAIVLI